MSTRKSCPAAAGVTATLVEQEGVLATVSAPHDDTGETLVGYIDFSMLRLNVTNIQCGPGHKKAGFPNREATS